jgi:pyruvate,water dikinase
MPYGFYNYDWHEDRDLDPENYDVWVCNVAHSVPAWSPLFCYEWYRMVPYAMMFAEDHLCEPTSKGWDWRVINGYAFISPLMVPENEVPARKEIYKKQLGPIMIDPWGYMQGLANELTQKYNYFRAMDPSTMRDPDLSKHLMDMAELERRMWEVHMLGWMGVVGGLRMWRELLRDLFGISPYDVRYAKLLSGFDNELFKLNGALADVAKAAIEMNLVDNFKMKDDDVIPAMKQSEAGQKWVSKLNQFLSEFGWRSSRMLETTHPTWIEKPSLAIVEIRRAISTGAEHAPDTHRARLRREGQELENELAAKLPADQAALFKELTNCAQAGHVWSESHDYWCEFQTFGLRRRAYKELSDRIYRKDLIDDPEDTKYLQPQDMIFCAVNQEHVGKKYLRGIIARHKKEHDYYLTIPPGSPETPIFMGDPARLQDAAARDTLFGVVAAPPAADAKEVGALAVGCAGAPGIVEGTARVIFSSAQWDEVKAGEILVCPMTDATWTPLFSMLKAIVTDSGGLLAHPAIVAREYGIPSVCGCQNASQLIKTGDWIRVDGDLLRVYKVEGK